MEEGLETGSTLMGAWLTVHVTIPTVSIENSTSIKFALFVFAMWLILSEVIHVWFRTLKEVMLMPL